MTERGWGQRKDVELPTNVQWVMREDQARPTTQSTEGSSLSMAEDYWSAGDMRAAGLSGSWLRCFRQCPESVR